MYKMLVVDDESWIRERLISTIDWEALGIGVVGEAGDGEEALTLAIEKRPDVILTDIRMPCLDGLEFVRRLKENGLSSRIIIISGYSDFEYTQKAIRLGADDYILKPVEDEDLISAVQHCLDDLRADIDNRILFQEVLNNNTGFLINTEHLINNLKVKNRQGVSQSLRLLYRQIEAGKEKYSSNLKVIYMNMVNLVFHSVFEGKEISGDFNQIRHRLIERIEKALPEEEMKVLIEEALQDVISALDKNEGGGRSKIVKKTEEYIRENYSKAISLNDAAQLLYLNASYLSKIFREETGEPFTKYLMKYRVDRAIELMNDPTRKIYEIAQRVGYEDIQYFSKMFRSITGVTPVQYREKIKP